MTYSDALVTKKGAKLYLKIRKIVRFDYRNKKNKKLISDLFIAYFGFIKVLILINLI